MWVCRVILRVYVVCVWVCRVILRVYMVCVGVLVVLRVYTVCVGVWGRPKGVHGVCGCVGSA